MAAKPVAAAPSDTPAKRAASKPAASPAAKAAPVKPAPAKPARATLVATKPAPTKAAPGQDRACQGARGRQAQGRPGRRTADKLTLIKGIGPVNERKLNEHGVYHFEQIAAWTKADIAAVEAYLAFDGRIAREDWIGQAKTLARAAPNPPDQRGALSNGRDTPAQLDGVEAYYGNIRALNGVTSTSTRARSSR